MLNKIIFSLKKFWQERPKLYEYITNPKLQTKTIFQLSLREIKKSGIEVLVLDYDAVLAAHSVNTLKPNVITWLKTAIDIFGKNKIYILSNNASKFRKTYFEKNLPGIIFYKPHQQKPYPSSLFSIMQDEKLSSQKMLIIDDRLLTGILAGILANVPAILVTKPEIDFTKHPMQEVFFIFLRKLERVMITLFRKRD